MPLSSEKLIEMYRLMVRVRLFEEAVARLLREGRIVSVVHLSAGQEAVAVGACSAIGAQDWITSTHRGHGHLIAKGGDIRRMFAELFGRVDGYCRGKGGSMHIADVDLGMLGANGIVGAGLPIAVGAAFASRYRGEGEVCLSFFGDGATNQGTFHEALNMAAILKLPAIFICENNLYGEWTRQDRHQAIRDVADRAAAYGMPGRVSDGMDVLAVRETVSEAVERARRGEGPSLLEFKTYRYFDHVGASDGTQARPSEELEEWRSRDPIPTFRRRLIQEKVVTEAEAEAIGQEEEKAIEEGISFAEASPLPETDILLTDVYAEGE
jgi:TPP-dependent pyruvate/acetoin dehydrogenase alpha subunit